MNKQYFIIPLLLLIVGCSTHSYVVTTQLGDLPESKDITNASIELYKEGMTVDKPYNILGKVFAERKYKKNTMEEDLIDLIREPAINSGADALIGFHSGILYLYLSTDKMEWGSALAVKYIEDKEVSPRADFMLTLLPVANVHELDSLDLEYHKECITNTAMYTLEKLGYYVTCSDYPTTYEEVTKMKHDELVTIGDHKSNLVMIITIEKIKGINVALMAANSAKLNAKLIMKDTGELILDKTRTSATMATGLLGVIADSSVRKNIASLCTENMLSDIPSCYDGFNKNEFEKYMEEEKKNVERRKRREERIKRSR